MQGRPQELSRLGTRVDQRGECEVVGRQAAALHLVEGAKGIRHVRVRRAALRQHAAVAAEAAVAAVGARDAAAAAAQRVAERARATRDERVEGVRVRLQAERVHAPAARRRV